MKVWRSDFRIVSCAFSWDGGDWCIFGEDDIRTALSFLAAKNIPCVVHNLGFEYSAIKCRFPDIILNFHSDTMRLTQMADNGGVGAEAGLGLQACAKRWLPASFHDHKEPFYKYLRDEHGIAKRKEGSNLHLLPREMLETYNILDTRVTLELYNTLTKVLRRTEQEVAMDSLLYKNVAMLIADARIRGVKVDTSYLKASVRQFNDRLNSIENEFNDMFNLIIKEIEKENTATFLAKYKTDRGRENGLKQIKEDPSLVAFNLSSKLHKKRLFVDKLGNIPIFMSPKGDPSFKKEVLPQWGDGGKLLMNKGTTFLSKTQCESLIERAEDEGRWHVDLMAAGTTTGRFKGAGGLNVQAMARKEPLLMAGIVADEGCVFVSVDLSAGEPTVTTELSKDIYYKAAVFDMVGKAPYYDNNGVLMIDDIYIMAASVSPFAKDEIRGLFESLDFANLWLTDPDKIKKHPAVKRNLHKILVLGIGYGMGAGKMVESAFKAGEKIGLHAARKFIKEYWNLFFGVKALSNRLAAEYEERGYLINIFGYHLYPSSGHKAFNYMIQSTVSGIINTLSYKFFTICKKAEFVTVIHDEIIFQVPEKDEMECKALFDRAVDSLNEDLGWEVKIRCGWKTGRNFYEAK